jgi:hypothetical protein
MSAAVFGIVAVAVLIIAAVLNLGIVLYLNRDITKVKFTFARTLQTLGHVFSAIMAITRSVIVVMGEANCPTWIAALFSISSFFYYFFSNIYYIELLKAISVDSKIFSKKNIQIFQWFTALVVVGCSGATVFRYTVYTDQSSNNWASKVFQNNVVGNSWCVYYCLLRIVGVRWGNLCVSCICSINEFECNENQSRI